MTASARVDILDTSELENLLGDGGSDNTGTTGSGGELHADRATLTSALAGNGMDLSNLVTPVTTTDGDKVELGNDESALNGNLDFLGDLDTETDVTILITDNDNSLEAGSLTSLSLLLDGNDLHDLIVEGLLAVLDELVNNGCLLDGDGVGVDFFERNDTVLLYETAELGHGDPIVLGSTTVAEATFAATAATTAAKSSTVTTATTCGCRFISSFHC